MTRSTSTPILIGVGFLLFALGLLAGVHLPRPSISSRMNDDLNDDLNNDLNGRNLRRQLQYIDPRTVTFKSFFSDSDSPPNSGFINDQQQVQQELPFQQPPQFQPQQPISSASGFDNNNYNHDSFSTEESRDVHVSSMCRCPAGLVPVPYANQELTARYQSVPKNLYQDGTNEARVIQPPSKATGSFHKRFVHHPLQECECRKGNGRLDPTPTKDKYLSQISRSRFEKTCATTRETESVTSWDQMPDFGVEDKPIFTGVLSFESPLSLNNSLHNWLENDLFRRIASQDVFVQLNHRSELDDQVVDAFQQNKLNNRHPLTITGSAEENLNPGVAISKFCRMAEQHPSSHPNGENLLLFLEKDWIIASGKRDLKKNNLERIFQSAIALSQRGVPFIGLRGYVGDTDQSKGWNCAAEGVPWDCTTAHQHRWTNWPALIDCSWFLRYLEPFALMSLTDPIMSCGGSYCDWEKATQDGRIAWTNSQWVIAHITRHEGHLFDHKEVDK